MESDGSEWKGDDKGVFNPFSVGPRNCIGRYVMMLASRLDVVACATAEIGYTDTPSPLQGI